MAEKLIFSKKLYIGDGIDQHKINRIKRRLRRSPLRCKENLIALSKNPTDQLDIIQARFLCQKYYEKNPLEVIGIAADYNDAVSIVIRITEECLANRGDCSLKEYLICKSF